MAEFTINPIPFAGGTLQWTANQLSLARLSSTRFIYAFSQTNPNYKYYGIADVPNVLASTPTVTIVKQRAYSGFFSQVVIERLDSTRFVAFDGPDMYVYNTATDDVIEELKVEDFKNNDYGNAPAQRLWVRAAGNNKLIVVTMSDIIASTNRRVEIVTVTYDPLNPSIQVSSPKILTAIVAPNNPTNQASVRIQPFPSDPNRFLISHAENAGAQVYTFDELRSIGIYSLLDDTIDIITPAPFSNPFRRAFPAAFGTDSVNVFAVSTSNQNAREYNGVSWGSEFQYAGANTNDAVHDVAILSPSYAMMLRKLGEDSGTGSGITLQDWSIRIINRQGPNNIVTSFPTNQGPGLDVSLTANTLLWPKRDIIDVFDPETVLLLGYNNQSAAKRFVVTRIKP
jgi:hypothetical protein